MRVEKVLKRPRAYAPGSAQLRTGAGYASTSTSARPAARMSSR